MPSDLRQPDTVAMTFAPRFTDPHTGHSFPSPLKVSRVTLSLMEDLVPQIKDKIRLAKSPDEASLHKGTLAFLEADIKRIKETRAFY